MKHKRRNWRRALFFLFFGLLLAGVGCEMAVRLFVTRHWKRERLSVLLESGNSIGKYRGDPRLPYALLEGYRRSDGFEQINALGMRGAQVDRQKPEGLTRVVCLGASTTYGFQIAPPEAYPAQLETALNDAEIRAQVLNAGVPGWVSREVRINFEHNVLPLEPDVIVVYMGRNELFPQAYNDYRPDYAHYRNYDYDPAASNPVHKRLFRLSHLAMLLCTYKGARFGWDSLANSPLYGCIRFENKPSTHQLIANLADPQRGGAYRRNLESIVAVCKRSRITAVLCSIAFRPQLLATGNVDATPEITEPLRARLNANNRIVDEVARQGGAIFVDTATLAAKRELFRDDCHMYPEGHTLRAAMIAKKLIKALE